MTEYIKYDIDTIRKRTTDTISKALDKFLIEVTIKKVYKENKKITVEGKYSTYFNEEGKFKIVFDEFLNLVNFEVL